MEEETASPLPEVNHNIWTEIINQQMWVLILLTSFIAIVLSLSASGHAESLLLISFLAGALGGVVNNHFRIQDRIRSEEKYSAPKVKLIKFQIYMSPLIGGALAIILNLVFVAHLISGEIFPAFKDNTYTSLSNFILGATPVNYKDAGKLLFWAFVAGFSEKFVPNYIDKLSSDTSIQNVDDS